MKQHISPHCWYLSTRITHRVIYEFGKGPTIYPHLLTLHKQFFLPIQMCEYKLIYANHSRGHIFKMKQTHKQTAVTLTVMRDF